MRAIDRSALPPALSERVVELDDREASAAFLARASPHGALRGLARRVLSAFVSDYDANAMLGMYAMHVLGTEAWRVLLSAGGVGLPAQRLVDVGAGDGGVTATLAPLFARVETTETSRAMARRLRARGFACHVADLAEGVPGSLAPGADVVAMLHVLDRCARPRTLLRACRALLAPHGRLVLAVPLPLSPHVHVAGGTVDAEESLPSVDGPFERCVASLVADVVAPAKLRVTALARASYLSQGDPGAPHYTLDDALLVLAPE